MAYSFTKSRNSILLAKYVTGFCLSRSTERGGAETVRAAFRSRARAAPLLGCAPPHSHTLLLHPHLGAHQIPPPHFRTAFRSRAAPLARVAPRPACRPFAPLARGPLACDPPLTRGPPCAWRPLRGPPLARSPVSPALSACAQSACGGGGAPKWRGEMCSQGGGDCPRTGGEGTVPCASPACVAKGEGVRAA